ncbi:MAG: hypothetical protein HRU70_01730 [Phycisphaeraceae bacterium]|nr:MAG: hypothetical protein HRU70_01730 [Phycisphaeraceae bacterium]
MAASRLCRMTAGWAAITTGAVAVSAACWETTTTDCCRLAGVVLNTTRKCGLFQDQHCPDKATQNTGNLSFAREAGTGKSSRSEGTSFTCKYQVGRCTGTLGSNLCEYNEEQTISCTTSAATGDACSSTPEQR